MKQAVMRGLVALIIGATLATACSSSKKDTSSSATSATSSDTGSASSTSSGSADSGSTDSSALEAQLMAPSDVEASFTKGNWTYTSDPLPCGQADPDSTTKPTVVVGVELDSQSRGLTLVEEVRAFKTDADAKAWADATQQGFACSKGTLKGSGAVQISAAQDVTSDLGVDAGQAWTLTTNGVQAEGIMARHANGVAVFLFAGPANADTSGVPNPLALAKAGVAKLH